MRLPASYTYSLNLLMRLRGNLVAGKSKNASDKLPAAQAPTSIPSKTVNVAPINLLPSWIPSFLTDILTSTTNSNQSDSPKPLKHCSTESKMPGKDEAKEQESPFMNMTCQEFAVYFPDDAPNFIDRPTFWPHDAAEQLTRADEKRQKNQTPQH